KALAFFVQAEDGIRDGHVTGVQTCALPISTPHRRAIDQHDHVCRVVHGDPEPAQRLLGGEALADVPRDGNDDVPLAGAYGAGIRSEERRVGKECGWGWWT